MNNFLEFVAGILNVPVESISLDTTYNSIPVWDSLMQIRLVMEIERKYSINIGIQMVNKIRSLGDFYKLIENKI